MFSLILDLIGLLNLSVFFGSMFFFFAGYALAPMIYSKKISWLLVYPMWIADKIELWMDKKWRPAPLFLFIFSMNSISLGIDFISGFVPFLPVFIAVWTGLNIGVIAFHTLKGRFYFASLLNPVALLELPAAFVVFTMAFQYNIKLLNIKFDGFQAHSFSEYFLIFLMIVLPLLIAAGLLETWLIFLHKKMENNEQHK